MAFQTEFEFTLPRGYVDNVGNIHKKGIMRLASAGDEIGSLKDPRIQQDPEYLTIVLLSKVVIRLGELPVIDTCVIEKLCKADFEYLQDFYQRINTLDVPL